MTTDLVFEKKGIALTNSKIISEKSNLQHESVVRMIQNNLSDFEEFGGIYFTDLKSGKRGRPTRVYHLNKEQATLLLTYLDNTEPVKLFKKNLVKAFFQMEQFIKNLYEAKADFPEFTTAIMEAHKEPKHYHFSNELDMINRIVLGMSSKEFKKANNLDKVPSIRPYLTNEQINSIKTLQRIDIGLIISIPDFQQRKSILQSQFERIQQKQISA